MPPRKRHPEVVKWIQRMSSKGGRNRAKSLTPERRKAIAAEGGQAVWKGVSPTERSERMKAVIAARWSKKKPKP
jgi:general stress protein YciG